MSKNSLIFHFVAHKPFLKTADEKYASKNQELFYTISQVYIPLLNMFANLESEGVPFKMGMTISPTLCAQLSDSFVQKSYIEWLDKLIDLGEQEIERTADNPKKNELSKLYLKNIKRNKRDYIETFNKDIVGAFSYYAKKGNIELFATAATYSFLPHIADFHEAVNAQIEQGLISHKQFFGIAPEGFFLPHLGYMNGLEDNLRAYGLNYTIVEAQSLLFATPAPSAGIFSPVRSKSSFAFFANDTRITDEIAGKNGFMYNEVYRNQQNDIGYSESLEDLKNFLGNSNIRQQTSFKYDSNKSLKSHEECIYSPEYASEQIKIDAQKFVESKATMLNEAANLLDGKPCSLLYSFSPDLLGEKWYEGIDWLEEVFRQIANRDDISSANCSDFTKEQYQLEKVDVTFSSSQGNGYGENFLDNSNDWMIRYMRKNTERMIDLAQRFSEKTGLKTRALNLATKEVLLSQSSDWPLMIHEKSDADFAKEQFIKTINGFSTVYESLGSNTISTEWLTNLEREHDLFPWTTYMIFSKKQ